MEGCGPATGSAPQSDSQGNSTGGEEEEVVKVEEAKDAKSNKKQPLHCPTCKVTVNSSSQLEAHCSGMLYNTTDTTSVSVYDSDIQSSLFQALSTNRCLMVTTAASHNAGSR